MIPISKNQIIHRILFFSLSGIFFHSLFIDSLSQTGDQKEDFLYGEYYINQNKYNEALPFFLSIRKKDSTNCNINYRIGECYYYILGKESMAIPYLQKATANIDANYMESKTDNESAPPNVLYLLADLYHKNNSLDSAEKYFNQYKSYLKKKDKKELRLTETKIQQITNARELQSNPMHFIEKNLGNTINTRFSDYNPVLSGDESMLLFTSFWESYDIIFFCKKKDGKWSEPLNINNDLGSAGDCYTTALSYDGSELLVVKMGNFNFDIYYSKYVNDKWTGLEPLNINSNYQETSACFSPDGNNIYFSSNRPGGEGGNDIYSAQRKGDKWVKINNLGKIINTPFNEEAPYMASDNQKLYFCSNGQKSMGDMDILYSEKKGKSWSEPVNIGYPLNTTGNNLFFIPVKEQYHGYLSKYCPDGFGRNDICKIIFKKEPEIISDAGHITNDTSINEADFPEPILPQKKKSDYTIQIMALLNPVDVSYFKNIDSVKVSYGNDKLYRYTYKEIPNLQEALKILKKVRDLYPDAFIRRTNTVSNY